MNLFIEIQGKKWPACYSLRAAMAVEDKFGSVKKALFEAGETAGERIRAMIFLLHELLKAGKAWAELEENEKDEEPPTEEQLLDMIPSAKIGEIIEQMIRVITDDAQSAFEAEEPEDRKNQKAT